MGLPARPLSWMRRDKPVRTLVVPAAFQGDAIEKFACLVGGGEAPRRFRVQPLDLPLNARGFPIFPILRAGCSGKLRTSVTPRQRLAWGNRSSRPDPVSVSPPCAAEIQDEGGRPQAADGLFEIDERG